MENRLVKGTHVWWNMNYDKSEGEYFHIPIQEGLSPGYSCLYSLREKVLSISYTMYSSDDPPLKFFAADLHAAEKIVIAFSNGMKIPFMPLYAEGPKKNKH